MTKRQRKHKQQPSQGIDRRLLWGVGIAIIILVVAGLVLVIAGDTEPEDTTFAASLAPEVSVDQAFELRDQGAFILDVREPDEWADFHIPGATLIPLGDLPDRVSEVPQDQDVVVVCRSGNRSATGRDILTDAGFTQVTSMAGGVTEWRAQGYPIE